MRTWEPTDIQEMEMWCEGSRQKGSEVRKWRDEETRRTKAMTCLEHGDI